MDVTDGVIGQSVRRSQILHMYLDGSIPLQIHYCNKARNQKGINSSPAGSLFHVPPSMTMIDFLPARPVRKAATAVAQAPVPQAWVTPEPRSHTRILIFPSSNTWANSTLMRSGKRG